MLTHKIHKFPKSRIATIDVCEIGKKKHHVVALLEMDVTISRQKVKTYKRETGRISFTAWLIKVVGYTITHHQSATGYLKGKRKAIIFDDVNISIIVEKEVNGKKVPIPVVIEKPDALDIETITKRLADSKRQVLTNKDVVVQRKSTRFERLYYHLPGFIRRRIWKYLLKHPTKVFPKMGNVAITSLGMIGRINGWFIPISIHPLCFGIGSIIKKPVVINDKIEIREIMNMTVLLDHDVMDGAPMARFIVELADNMERGIFL